MNKKNNDAIDFSKEPERGAVKPKTDQQSSGLYVSPESPQIVKLAIGFSGGLIKNEKQAYYFISGLVVILFIITIFLISGGTKRKSPEETFSPSADAPAEEVIPPSF